MTFIVWDIGTRKMIERTKASNLIVDYFSLTFVNLFISLNVALPCMMSEYQKFLVPSEYYN